MSHDVAPDVVFQFMAYIESLGVWAHGGDVSRTVDEWMFTNVSFDEAVDYLEAGCFDPVSAAQLKAVGVYGDDLDDVIDDHDGISLGYGYASGIITLDALLTRIGR